MILYTQIENLKKQVVYLEKQNKDQRQIIRNDSNLIEKLKLDH